MQASVTRVAFELVNFGKRESRWGSFGLPVHPFTHQGKRTALPVQAGQLYGHLVARFGECVDHFDRSDLHACQIACCGTTRKGFPFVQAVFPRFSITQAFQSGWVASTRVAKVGSEDRKTVRGNSRLCWVRQALNQIASPSVSNRIRLNEGLALHCRNCPVSRRGMLWLLSWTKFLTAKNHPGLSKGEMARVCFFPGNSPRSTSELRKIRTLCKSTDGCIASETSAPTEELVASCCSARQRDTGSSDRYRSIEW